MQTKNLKQIPVWTAGKYQSGVTLVELIIYMGIFMGFMTLLSGLFVSILNVQQESMETARMEQDVQYLFARLQYDVSRASELVLPANNGDTGNTLTLITPDGTVSYSLSSEQLMIAVNGGAALSLLSSGNSITQFELQRLGNLDGVPSVKIEMDIESQYQGAAQPAKRELSYTFGLRQN